MYIFERLKSHKEPFLYLKHSKIFINKLVFCIFDFFVHFNLRLYHVQPNKSKLYFCKYLTRDKPCYYRVVGI